MDVSLGLISFILVVSMTAVQSVITKGPANALKKIGDSVTLECVMSSNNCEQVDWSKVEGPQSPKLVFRNSVGMLNNVSFPPNRYNVSRNGGCNLTIKQLEINDSGRFICMQGEGDKEYTRSSILVVISVAESCQSDFVNDEVAKGDNYKVWCVINVPRKALEPSNVALSFPNKAADENETTEEMTPTTIKTTLTATVTKTGTMKHVCIASFEPSTQLGFDNTTAYLEVCNITQEITVKYYPVQTISVWPPPPYHVGTKVNCTAKGYPTPTCSWKKVCVDKCEIEHVVQTGSTLEITGNDGDKYTCTATNTVKGKETSMNYVIAVGPVVPEPEPDPGTPGSVVAIVICVFFGGTIIVVVVVVLCGCYEWCTFYVRLRSIVDNRDCPECCCCLCVCCWKKKKDKKGKKSAEQPLTETTSSRPTNTTNSGPTKPPRMSDAPNRPGSECKYIELQPESKPHQMKSNPVNNSSTVYATVSVA